MRLEVVWFLLILWSTLLFAEDTELSFYRPMTVTSKQPSVEITSKTSGECWQQSQRIKREDAWRCIAQGKTYDPCFVKPFGSHLDAICPESPWATRAIQIDVSSPLDNSHHVILDMSQAFPWAIVLANGDKCYSIESTELYDDLPVRYRCDKNKQLIGNIQRCNTTWKMLQRNAEGVSTVDIARAWF